MEKVREIFRMRRRKERDTQKKSNLFCFQLTQIDDDYNLISGVTDCLVDVMTGCNPFSD